MKKTIRLLLLAFAAATLTSCGQNEGKKALLEMERIVEKAEKNKEHLTAHEWEELTASFEENEKVAHEAAETGELSIASKMKYLTLSARWAAARGPSALHEITEKAIEALSQDESNDPETNPDGETTKSPPPDKPEPK